MDKKMYYQVVAAVFALIALLHIARVYYGWEAMIGEAVIPLWYSYVAVAIAVYLAYRGWQFSQKAR